MNAFTPGPWLAKDAGVVSMGGGSNVVCEAPIHYLESAKNWEANARLIAAAPQLLEVLLVAECGIQELCNDQDPANECWNTLRLCRAVIAAATGTQSTNPKV
jgi:hypothetical protein